MRTFLTHSFRDPNAPPEIAASYRTSQFNEVAKQLPTSILGNLIIIFASLQLALRAGQHVTVIATCGLILLIGGTVNTFLWWHYWKKKDAPAIVPPGAVSLLCGIMGLSGLLYGVLMLATFDFLTPDERVMLTGVAAAVVGISAWMYAALPVAGLLWADLFCTLVAAGFFVLFEGQHAVFGWLLVFYGVFLTSCVLATSHRFIVGLIANTEVARQRELVSLLLRDFEENTSDWLWETDASGRLVHVSVLLANATGGRKSTLIGQSMLDVLRTLAAPLDTERTAQLDKLTQALEARQPFRKIIIQVQSHGRLLWWSFSGKPQFDANQRFTGWRGVASDISAECQHELQLSRLARFDKLTGLANRYHFHEYLDGFLQPLGQAKPCSLFLLDLDNFKVVNDTLGHAAGDALLREIGRRLKRSAKGRGWVARLGGDEFAWVVPGVPPKAEIEAMHQHLRKILAARWKYRDYNIVMHVSIGASFAPADATTAEDLMRTCDMALYAAKALGRDALCYFAPEMQARVSDQMTLLSDLRKSLAAGDFELHYQPQIALDTGRIASFEALVRWRHPERGMISPQAFIPLAESSGLILPLGEWVLNQACRDARHWPPEVRVAVNVAAVQIERSDMYAAALAALQRSGLAPQRLELELTESSLARHEAATLALFKALRAAGIRVALDDFGTGYSSLSYLRTFPMDKLKIDRSFITMLGASTPDASAAAIVKTIIELANILNLETTAEGVETEQQMQALAGVQCTYAQGYLLGKPMNAAQAIDFIANWVPEKNLSPRVDFMHHHSLSA